MYDKYLDALEELFNCLLDADAELFTAYYKLEIPFIDHYKNIIASFWNCLELDDPHRNWCESINVDLNGYRPVNIKLPLCFQVCTND